MRARSSCRFGACGEGKSPQPSEEQSNWASSRAEIGAGNSAQDQAAQRPPASSALRCSPLAFHHCVALHLARTRHRHLSPMKPLAIPLLYSLVYHRSHSQPNLHTVCFPLLSLHIQFPLNSHPFQTSVSYTLLSSILLICRHSSILLAMAASTAFVAGSAMVAAPVSMDLSSCKAFGSSTSTLVHAAPVSRAYVSKVVAVRASSNSEVRMWYLMRDYPGYVISCSMCSWASCAVNCMDILP